MRNVLVLAACMLPAACYAQCVGGQCGRSVTSSVAMSFEGIQLAAGETLIAVNGVPVEYRQRGPVAFAVAAVARPIVNTVRAVGDSLIVNRDERAYLHAMREAQILANRMGSGHPLGVAPGCRYSGTGTSLSPNRPNHCYANLPNSRLVARAMVAGSDGRYYWSAHYR